MAAILIFICAASRNFNSPLQGLTVAWSLTNDWLLITCLLMFAQYCAVLNFVCANLGNCSEGEDCRCCSCNCLHCCRYNCGSRYNNWCSQQSTGVKVLTAVVTILSQAAMVFFIWKIDPWQTPDYVWQLKFL